MKHSLSLLVLLAAIPANAEDTRQLDEHEHGVGTLNIAVEGSTIAMEFEAPGADIVGFEYGATTDADHAAIDAALETLGAPLDLFAVPDEAACSVVDAKAQLESDDAHEEHSEDHHDEHHNDDDHKDKGHEEHDEHFDEAGHTEFHAEYVLSCENPDALTEIKFTYFEAFPNAQEVEVQIIDATGARAFEVERDTPVLDLDG
jgi:hypothetical protein